MDRRDGGVHMAEIDSTIKEGRYVDGGGIYIRAHSCAGYSIIEILCTT